VVVRIAVVGPRFFDRFLYQGDCFSQTHLLALADDVSGLEPR
jgi:hypothetical protein